MNREQAAELVKQNVKNENLFKHMLAVEAIMKGVAKHLNEDTELWGMTGLLHDIDFEKAEHKEHGLVAEQLLNSKVSEEIIRAIKSHNFENTNIMPQTKMEKVLVASDSLSGLVIACALIIPTKKLADLEIKTIENKFKQKDFARNCSREKILICKHVGLDKEKFFEIALKSLQEISKELGL